MPGSRVQEVRGLLPCMLEAAKLIRHYVATARARGKKGVVLTCKDHMIRFYERAGFTCKGVSASSHGGAKWNDMLIEF